MFKIEWMHNIEGNTPKEWKKIKGIRIVIGYHCAESYECDCGKKCKYRKSFTKRHNRYVAIRNWFERKLHIKLPWFIHIDKQYTHLSGTTMCPFHKSRLYTCWDCKYCDGDPDGVCLNPRKKTATKEETDFTDPEWGKHHRCGLFEKDDFADDFDPHTGMPLYSSQNDKK